MKRQKTSKRSKQNTTQSSRPTSYYNPYDQLYKKNTSTGTYQLDEYRKKKVRASNGSTRVGIKPPSTNVPQQKSTAAPNKAHQSRGYSQDAYSTRPYGQNPYQANNYQSNPYQPGPTVTQGQSGSYEERRTQLRKDNKITRQEAQRLKKRKKKVYVSRLIAVIVVVAGVSYTTVKLVEAFTYPTVSYQTVQVGTIDNTSFYQGIVVRDETVYEVSSDGDIHYVISEGEKVRKGGEVCYQIDKDNFTGMVGQIEAIDESIYAIQKNRENLTTYQKELYQLHQSAYGELKQYYHGKNMEGTQDVYMLRRQLDKLVQQKTTIYTADPIDATATLQEDKVALEHQLLQYSNAHVANEGGVVSYYIDSLTGLTKEDITNLDYNAYQKLIKKGAAEASSKEEDEKIPLFKVVTSNNWQLVTYVPTEDAKSYVTGQYYTCKLVGAEEKYIPFKLITIEEGSNRTKLVFETSEQVTSFLNKRVVAFSIGENKAEGLKIPLDAVVERMMIGIPKDYILQGEKQEGVLRVVGESSEFVPVNVQYTKQEGEQERSYYIQQLGDMGVLRVNDKIVHPTTGEVVEVTEVESAKGVYTINGRYAKFKSVEIVLVNEGYAIVGEDSQLKEFDQIISNPMHIEEEQLLKHMNIQNE